MWDVIALIPDHCLSVYFAISSKSLLCRRFTWNIKPYFLSKKDKCKKNKVSSAAILFDALRVNRLGANLCISLSCAVLYRGRETCNTSSNLSYIPTFPST